MKLLELKKHLNHLNTIAFQLPNGEFVPKHFHITEIGNINKHFIDCGGTLRTESTVTLQLWSANDYNHQLHPEKFIKIIELSEKALSIDNLDIEVEYQGKQTIETYTLDFNGTHFMLKTKFTDCLAKDKCNPKENSNLVKQQACCQPNSGCC